MVEKHAGAGIAHDGAYLFFHRRFIAVYRTLTAGFLVFLERTPGQSGGSIIQQSLAVVAQRFVALLVAAIETYHQFDGSSFFFYP